MSEQTTDAKDLERTLREDLRSLGDRMDDADFAGQLYRSLAGRTWHHEQLPGHVALSWKRAEEIVNQLRGERGHDELTLAQTGGEGFPSDTVEDELGGRGWRSQPLNTSREDSAHVDSARDEPRTPPNADERFARAHEEAEQERTGRVGRSTRT